MSPLILYYSRTGNTRKLANVLATRLDAPTAEIGCKRYDGGLFQYLRAGYDSVRGNMPPIEVTPEARMPHNYVLIGCPIWTSYPALPVRRFLADYGNLNHNVAFFLTYGGHSPPEKAFTEIAAIVKQPAKASLALNSADLETQKATEAISEFLNKLGVEWPTLRS